jgi:hypothetical protein
LAQKIKGDLNWLKEAEQPAFVVVDDDDKSIGKYLQFIEVVKIFMSYPKLYSWHYIALMRTQLNATGLHCLPNITIFLDILNHNKVTFFPQTLPTLLEKFLSLKGGSLTQIKVAADELLLELSPNMNDLLTYIEVALPF